MWSGDYYKMNMHKTTRAHIYSYYDSFLTTVSDVTSLKFSHAKPCHVFVYYVFAHVWISLNCTWVLFQLTSVDLQEKSLYFFVQWQKEASINHAFMSISFSPFSPLVILIFLSCCDLLWDHLRSSFYWCNLHFISLCRPLTPSCLHSRIFLRVLLFIDSRQMNSKRLRWCSTAVLT